MSALSINAPFVLFTDADGSSLDQGYIYIGTAGLPAESNQVSVYWDAALTIPAVQPIRTLGGYAVRAGTPSIFYVDATDYSISIKNKNNALVYQALNDGARVNFSQIAGTVPVSQGGTGATTATAARAALSVAPRANRIDVASVAGTVDLTTNAPDSDDIRITGTLTITGFTVAVGRVIRVTAGGAFTLTNNSSIVTQTGANIVCASGDTFMLRATATNTVEVLNFVSPVSSGIPTVISNSWSPGTRQTVRSGPVDSNGLADFGGSTGSTEVTAAGTLYVTAANGILDRNGSITNPSWTGLTANAFLYLDIAADGTCTTGSTALAPTYRRGGADVVTSGQATFNIQEMQMKVGNGSAAVQTYRVFVGEVTASGTVSAITWYQPMGRYSNEQSTIAVSTAYSFNHNIGSSLLRMIPWIECKTTDLGYAVGDRVYSIGSDGNGSAFCGAQMWSTYKTCGFTMGSGAGAGVQLPNKGTGSIGATTVANWKVGFEVIRGW